MEEGFLTWYDARQRARLERGVMRWEYRLYFPTNQVSQCANAGDVLVIAKRPDNTLLSIVAEAGTTISQQVLWLFGVSDLSHPGFSVRDELETEQDRIEFASRFILESLGIAVEVSENTYLDEMIDSFLVGSQRPENFLLMPEKHSMIFILKMVMMRFSWHGWKEKKYCSGLLKSTLLVKDWRRALMAT